MNRYLISTYYEQSSLGNEPFSGEFTILLEFQRAALWVKSRPEWIVQEQPNIGQEKVKEDEEVSIWRVTKISGERGISAIIMNWNCISYLWRCNKYSQISQLETTNT